jgi:hypothetical protein
VSASNSVFRMSANPRPSFFELDLTSEQLWMMQLGERYALEGLLTQLRPRLSIEVGTYDGGSLRRIAAHSTAVEAFDIDPRSQQHADHLENVTLHLGDSAQTLPRALAEIAARERRVDFALVDGLHTYDAVTADAEALLESPACERTVIVFHDSAHADVRRALEDLKLRDHPKVGLALLDFVPGYVVRDDSAVDEEVRGRSFNGLGLVVLDATHHGGPTGHEAFVSFPELRRGFSGAPRGGWRGKLAQILERRRSPGG